MQVSKKRQPIHVGLGYEDIEEGQEIFQKLGFACMWSLVSN